MAFALVPSGPLGVSPPPFFLRKELKMIGQNQAVSVFNGIPGQDCVHKSAKSESYGVCVIVAIPNNGKISLRTKNNGTLVVVPVGEVKLVPIVTE